MAKKVNQGHFGRISSITNQKTGAKSFRTGTVQEASGGKYKGARSATIDHVIRLVKKIKGQDVTISAQGRYYTGDNRFTWTGTVADKNSLIQQLENHKQKGSSMEDVARDIFNLRQQPDLINAWEAREHK